MSHVTHIVRDTGAQAHASVVERSAVQRGSAVVSDRAVEELVAFTDAFFTDPTGSVLSSLKVAVAVFLAGLVGNALAVAGSQLTVDQAEFASVGAISVSLTRRTRILNTSFITANLTLLAIGIVLTRRLTRDTLIIAAEFVSVAISAAETFWSIGTSISCDRRSGV